MRGRRTLILLGLPLFVLLFVCGCSSIDDGPFPRIVNEPAPLPNEVRSRFGRMAILPPAAATNIQFTRPVLPASVSHNMAMRTYAKLEGAVRGPDGQLEHAIGRIAYNALLAASLHGVAGIVGLSDEAAFQQGQHNLRAALTEESLEHGIEAELKRIASRQRGTNIVLLSETDLGLIKLRGVRPDFSDLLGIGVDSVLDIRVGDVGFDYREGETPAVMAFAPEVIIYVLRTIDGAVLHASYLEYRGSEYRFATWANNDARAMRIELNLAARTFAQSIIEQYFAIDARELHGPAPVE